MSYVVGKGMKLVEEDDFEKGCLPETAFEVEVDIPFKGETVEELLEDIGRFFRIDAENIERNAEGVEGLIRFDVLENGDAETADESEIETWKEGELKLYSCVYRFEVFHKGIAEL